MISTELLEEIGRFGKPHGLKGEITALMTTDVDADSLPCIFVELDGLLVPFFISSVRTKGSESVLLTIDGVDTQERALRFTNKSIYARTQDLPEDDEDDNEGFYLEDLIGYTIVNDGKKAGRITDFDDSTDNYLFSIETPDGNTFLVPANADLIENIDPESQTIYMNLPIGLTDL